ncbi:MAG: TIGR03364 family FAD-dependent oxidoreductase [Oscillochloris sp.]|nr:TIGR03364 family FAD-dependent oxidoreductase [Oscillochloris sp.]
MRSRQVDIAVVGAGIVGLAFAYAYARRGKRVVVFERSERAVGASIRNFGLVWPIGQPAGRLFQRALRSRAIWQDLCRRADLWCNADGSLHLAYHADELAVLEEYLALTPDAAAYCRLLNAEQVAQLSPAARTTGLLGALWSRSELNVDPRQVIGRLPLWLNETYGVEFRFGEPVYQATPGRIVSGGGIRQAERAIVASGADFATLYPQVFSEAQISRCKLQMLRTVAQPGAWQLGPTLCGGLTLLHYAAFRDCPSLSALRRRLDTDWPLQRAEQIHVMLSQTALGELTIGDHHEYGRTFEPFDREAVNQAILQYLATFAHIPDLRIAERWHGVYALIPGQSEFIAAPEPGVMIVNGLGGAGMTLAFGLADEIVQAEG